jgi:hypothetical protein
VTHFAPTALLLLQDVPRQATLTAAPACRESLVAGASKLPVYFFKAKTHTTPPCGISFVIFS